MNKKRFLSILNKKLIMLPKQEVKERLNFYSEMIDDRIEDGLSEEEAVLEIGDIEEVANQIIVEVTGDLNYKSKSLTKRELILLIIGAPLWVPLLISVFTIILSLFITLLVLVITLFAVFISLFASGVFAGLGVGLFFSFTGNELTGIALIGAGLFCIGLSIFAFYGFKELLKFSKHLIVKMKRRICHE